MTALTRCLNLAALATIALTWACATAPGLKSLDKEGRNFLSEARYIITKQERQRFLAIPATEREAFIEEFWEKRDPTPGTQANEFKDRYFKRIGEANHLFSEAAEPGWLQDRGRIYILLGPPTNRFAYPRGMSFYDVPREIWYYGFFPILFTDEAWNGNYKLDPISVEQISIINRAGREWQPQVAAEKGQMDFDIKVKKAGTGRALIKVAIPFRTIWFDLKEKVFLVTFVVTCDLIEMDGTEVHQTRIEHQLKMNEDELRKSYSENCNIEIPIDVPGSEYWLRVTLENTNDGSKAYKRIKLTV